MEIKTVRKDGIEYIDTNKKISYINFAECNENWLAYRKRTENLSHEQIALLRNKDKTVGQRDDSPKCFIEFFTRPFTRFEFQLPEQKEEYEKLWFAVWNHGWSTIDWS